MESIQQGHILKFVARGRTFDPNVGIRTYPRQTYGLSEESPDQFKTRHSLTGDHGYIYRHEDKPQFEYPSQRRFFDVHRCSEEGSPAELQNKLLTNSVTFHRKKGRLSEFMDKNGWMSPVVHIMGYERTDKARVLSNRDRQNRINALKVKPAYQNPTAKKPEVSPQYSNTISVVMTEKLRIRNKRQDLARRQVPATARAVPEQHCDQLEVENIEEKINKNNMDFYSTCSTFFPRGMTRNGQSREFPTRISNRLERANSEKKRQEESLNVNFRTVSPVKQRRGSPAKCSREKGADGEMQNLRLDDWYRKTCHSKWVYNPKKIDREEFEEESQMQPSTNF